MSFALDVFSVTSTPKTAGDDVPIDVVIVSKPVEFVMGLRIASGDQDGDRPSDRVRERTSQSDDVNYGFNGKCVSPPLPPSLRDRLLYADEP